ncbi:hypothetical protein BJ684DRAFT_18991 [Piptocephalis cylindrospora]|uniref:Peripheral subunit-binding (PSBD) domain-containing protein n=1 Tax=Piptocephalis cylindrospora TaxID=1907219 RepID=A0A4P9Y6M1_9FUNG|nr:hypothetical protein BJ684DRAFT_18991 [Piptocephalis cylindrospora]|eukprot:RKP14613.1 hypothetical protein BJ684DRAFT_18991 [Piptocephalis cylindrospora]
MPLPLTRPFLARVPRLLPVGARAASTFTPAVGFLLDRVGIDQDKASRIPTTGPKGRLLKGDVLAYLGRIKARPAPEWNSTSYPPFGQGATASTSSTTSNSPFECRWRGISLGVLTSKCATWSDELERRVKVEEVVARALSLSLAATISSSSTVKAACVGPSGSHNIIQSTSKDTPLSDFLSTITKDVSSSSIILDITTSGSSSSAHDPDLTTTGSDLVFASTPTPFSSISSQELSMDDVFTSLLPTPAQSGQEGTMQLTLRSLPGSPLDPDQIAEVMGRMVNLLEDPARLS